MKNVKFYLEPTDGNVYYPYPVIEGYKRSFKWAKAVALHFRLLPLRDMWREDYLNSIKRYELISQSLKAYLDKNGYIPPLDREEFMEWFADNGMTNWTVFDPLPEIQRGDFILFSKYQEQQIQDYVSASTNTIKIESEGVSQPLLAESRLPADLSNTVPSEGTVPLIKIVNNKISLIYNALSSYFHPDEADSLLRLLRGEYINQSLTFTGSQSQLGEFFRRAEYNKCIISNKTEITDWLCAHFKCYKQGGKLPEKLNKDTLYKLIAHGKDEVRKGRRIETNLLPYRNPEAINNEKIDY